MDPKTDEHLRAAERNRALARALVDPSLAGLRPPPWEWVAVIAFYAAVHYANAYLWESARFEPKKHDQRAKGVRRDPKTRGCRANYERLQTLGYQARYEPTFTLSEQDARDLVDGDLRAVQAALMAALNLPPLAR